jgi:hypothetical protein
MVLWLTQRFYLTRTTLIVMSHDRPSARTGGGILFAGSSTLHSSRLGVASILNCEAVCVEIQLRQNKRLLVGIVYLPPNIDSICIEQ